MWDCRDLVRHESFQLSLLPAERAFVKQELWQLYCYFKHRYLHLNWLRQLPCRFLFRPRSWYCCSDSFNIRREQRPECHFPVRHVCIRFWYLWFVLQSKAWGLPKSIDGYLWRKRIEVDCSRLQYSFFGWRNIDDFASIHSCLYDNWTWTIDDSCRRLCSDSKLPCHLLLWRIGSLLSCPIQSIDEKVYFLWGQWSLIDPYKCSLLKRHHSDADWLSWWCDRYIKD